MKNGKIAKGHTTDFSQNKPFFHLTADGDPRCVEKIDLENLKAIFFVKDFKGDFLHIDSHGFLKAPVSGKHIVITFYDGEIFFGTSDGIHRDKIGFFIFSIDQEANTSRAFVINSFIDNIEIVS